MTPTKNLLSRDEQSPDETEELLARAAGGEAIFCEGFSLPLAS